MELKKKKKKKWPALEIRVHVSQGRETHLSR